MIAFLEGQVKLAGERYIIIQAGGIGFKVFTTGRALAGISEGQTVSLWCYHHIFEGGMQLFGFSHMAEVEFFESLIGVSGIGPKSALAVLNMAPLDTLKKAISAGETKYLTKVSGVGHKTAEKIIFELKDKMGASMSPEQKKNLQDDSDALDALVSLGYSLADVRIALQKVPDDIRSVGGRIKHALKLLQ